MKVMLAILCPLLTLAVGSAQEITMATDPGVPTEVDPVRLTFARDFPSPCFETTATFNRNGNTIEVELNSAPTGGICPQVIAPQTATIALGQLPPGIYQIHWVWNGIPGSRGVPGSSSFQVVPIIQLAGNDPVEIRFQSAPNATYQAKWSPDLVRWFDLGSPVPGTGNEVTIEDAGEPTTDRYYRVQQTAAPSGLQ